MYGLNSIHFQWIFLFWFKCPSGHKKAENRFHNYFCRIGLSLQSQLSFFGTHPFLFFKNLPLHFSNVNLSLVLGIILLFILAFYYPFLAVSPFRFYEWSKFLNNLFFRPNFSLLFLWISIENHLLFSHRLPILDLLFLLWPQFVFMWDIIMWIPIANKSDCD